MAGLTTRDWARFEKSYRPMSIDEEEVVEEFVGWLLHKPEGDEALRHINNTKRQRFLPFDSQGEE